MEQMIKIYDVETNQEKYSALYEEGSKRGFMLMQEDYVELVFKTRKKRNFGLGDYIVLSDFGRFELTTIQQPHFNSSTRVFEYTLRFNAPYYHWKNKKFKFEPTQNRQEVSFSLTDKLKKQMQVLINNIAYYGWQYTWNYEGGGDEDLVDSTQYMTYDNISVLDALTKIAEAYGVEWWITDNIIHLGRVEIGYTGVPTTFELGKNVAEISDYNSAGDSYFNVFTAFGSSKNLPTNYRKTDDQMIVNGVVQKRLMLPSSTPLIYLDGITKDSPLEHKVEGIVVFEDVFPKTDGEVASVTSIEKQIDVNDPTTGEDKKETVTSYRFKDKSLVFDEAYILKGQALEVVFSSGALNGMTFEVKFNPLAKSKSDADYQLFEIVRNENYGMFLPAGSLIPKVGDKYTLVGFDATKIADMGLIQSAENELKERAEKYAKKLQIDPNNYDCTMLADYMYGRNDSGELDRNFAKMFSLGDKVNIKDANLFKTGSRLSRVIGFKYELAEPYNNAVITVGENVTYSRSSAMEGNINAKLENIIFGGQNVEAGSGQGGASVYIITSNDSTTENDSNVYSAKRAKDQFANKKANDNISALWSFNQSTNKRGIQTHHYTNDGNADNMFGKGFQLVQQMNSQGNSTSRLEVDELLVRMRAVFASLEIRQMSYVGGNYVFSAAGSKLYHVKPMGSFYRCYMYTNDGTTATMNNWTEDDQALCETFDIDVSSGKRNKRYWRRVVGTGKEQIQGKTLEDGTQDTTKYQYADLSKTDCELGSDVPESGDTVVQFGNWTDASRQGIIYIMVVGDMAPAIIEYANVGKEHFVWPEADTQISPRGGNIFKGKFFSVANGSTHHETIQDQINSLISDYENLKNQADKKMDIWFNNGTPLPNVNDLTHSSVPANEWTTEALKDLHVGDLYYDTQKEPGTTGGRAYRWVKMGDNYFWAEVTDQDTIAALEKIADVASDGVLSSGAEKSKVLVEWNDALSAYQKYDEQAKDYIAAIAKYKIDFSGMITAYDSFVNAFHSLANMLNAGEVYTKFDITPIWLQDLKTSTKINADEYRANWSEWHTSLVSLLKAISKAAQLLANKAQDTADDSAETLVNMASDNVITAQEKTTLSMMWDNTRSEYENICEEWEKCNAYGSELQELTNIYEALSDIMSEILSDMGSDSDLIKIKATYDDNEILFSAAWAEYYARYGYVRETIARTTKTDIDDAYDIGSNAYDMCDAMVSDGKLDPLEKIIIKRDFFAAYKEKNAEETGILDRAKDIEGNYVVNVATYISAFRAYGTYLNGGVSYMEPESVEDWADASFPSWIQETNMRRTETVDAQSYREKISDFTSARNELLAALANKAQEDANKAQEEAITKAQIFITQPYPPYKEGDMWYVDANKCMICVYSRSADESFDIEDWIDFIEEKEYVDKRNSLSQFANVYEKRYGDSIEGDSVTKVYISTKEHVDSRHIMTNESYGVESMRSLYLATHKFTDVNPGSSGWSNNVPVLSEENKYLWHCVEVVTTQKGMLIYSAPTLLHTFRGRDKIVKVKPYYQTVRNNIVPSSWSETPVKPVGEKPCLWMKFDLTCMEDDTYESGLGNIKFDGECAYVFSNASAGWSRPTMITDDTDSLFATLKALQGIFGGITITLYPQTNDEATDYDLAIRKISYKDTFKNEEKLGPCEILMLYNGTWELLQESVTAMIENLGEELRWIVFGADGKNTVDTSGLVTKTKFNELFSQKVTTNTSGQITNIDKSGLLTTADFATLFSEALAADGTVVKKSEITAFVTKDADGFLQSGVKIKADAIELEGVVTANDNFKILTDGSMECKNGNFSGKITSSEGVIGGFTIDGTSISSNIGNSLILNSETGEVEMGGGAFSIDANKNITLMGQVKALRGLAIGLDTKSGNVYSGGVCESWSTFVVVNWNVTGGVTGDLMLPASHFLVDSRVLIILNLAADRKAIRVTPQPSQSIIWKGKSYKLTDDCPNLNMYDAAMFVYKESTDTWYMTKITG